MGEQAIAVRGLRKSFGAKEAVASGAALPLARYGLRGAVAARFWIYQRREPTSLIYWAMTAVIMVVVSASTIFGPHQHPAVVIASAVFGAVLVASSTPTRSA